jgi:hypothetical protein
MILCRKRGFIKNNMSGEIDPVSRKIKTPITSITISYENTNFRLVFQLMSSVGSKKGKTFATKNTKSSVIGSFKEKFFKGTMILKNRSRKSIYDKN